MKNKKVWVIILILIVLAILIGARRIIKARHLYQEYKTVIVTKGDITASVSSTGRLNPVNTVQIGSQVSGNVREIFVDFNSPVKKDQVIAIIDPAVYAVKVEQSKAHLLMAEMQLLERLKGISVARADVQSANAHIDSANAVLREANLRYNRLVTLRNNKIISKSEFDSAEANKDNALGTVKMAEAKLQTAEAQVKRAIAQKKGVDALISERKAALNLAEIQLNYCTIKSPIDGMVISREIDVGQTVAATLQSPILFLIAENLSRMQVEVDVSEADVGQIKQNQDVIFTVDAFPDKEFKANVQQVRNAATSIQNVVIYKIIADVENDSLELRPGMTANVTILISNVKDTLKIPNSALRFKMPGKKYKARSTKVYTLDNDNKLIEKKIMAGITDEVGTQILSGLKEGDKVIVGLKMDSDTSRESKNIFSSILKRNN